MLPVLPLTTTQIVAYLVALALGVCGWVKRKAIGALLGALRGKTNKWFWGYVHERLKTVDNPAPATPSDQRTYRGRFRGYWQYENPPREWFFEIENDGTFTKVPVVKTNLLSGVNPGTLVEIDTTIGPYYGFEVVLRVRVSG